MSPIPVAGTSAVNVHQAGLAPVSPDASGVRVHSASLDATAAVSAVRVHTVTVDQTGAGSSVRVHSLGITGAKAFQQIALGNYARWDSIARVWKSMAAGKVSFWNQVSLAWRPLVPVVGVPGDPPPPPPPPVPNGPSPIADAGALPIGQAAYPVPTGAVYMAVNGSDSTGDGSLAKPYASLNAAYAAVPSGGTIVIRAGVYNDGGDTQNAALNLGVVMSTKPVTIQNYPNEAVWFDGSRPATAWTVSGSAWRTPYDRMLDRSPTDARGANDSDPRPGWGWTNPAYPYAQWPDQVFMDGTPLTQVGALADVGPGKFFVAGAATGSGKWFKATDLYLGSDPNGHELRVTDKVKFLTMLAAGSTIRGIGVRRYSPSIPDAGMIQSSRANITWENVRLEDSSANAIQFSGTATADASGQVVRKVTILRPGALGIHVFMADRILIDRVDIQYANSIHLNYAPQTGAIKAMKSQGVTVRNSLFANNYTKAFWTDMSVDTAVFVNNMVQNCEQFGIVLEIGSKAIVANNKFVGCGRDAICVQNTNLARLWNNTIVDAGGNAIASSGPISFVQDDRRSDDGVTGYGIDQRQPASYYADPANRWQINDLEMANCIMARPRSGSYRIFCIDDLGRNQGVARPLSEYHPVVDSNLYHWTTQPTYPWIMPPTTATGSPLVYFTLAALQKATGLDLKSTFTTVDPLNLDLTVKDATLHAKARPLPGDIATLISQPTNAQHLGCFW